MQGYNCIMVYHCNKKELLFCKRVKEPYKGKYNLVGGKIEANETESFFDQTRFAGEGNIGHMVEQVVQYGVSQ